MAAARVPRTVLLIDGNSLTYRAFFALPTDLATASGQVTNAVFGFTSMLVNLLRDHRPDAIAVAFDLPQPTFRHERVETYKANREAAPDILRQQMGLVRQVVESLRIPIFEVPGFEADDVIATLATQGRDAGDDVIIVTGDRDSYQLVEDPHIKVLYNKRGVSDYALYDEAGIAERTGVPPTLYPQYAALRGDPSDNLPGVPGVGEKTAAKLITTYGGIDGIFEHLADQTPKLRENLAAHEANVRQNAEVMVLVRDVPLDHGITDLAFDASGIDVGEVRRLFEFLEFNTLFDRLAGALDTDLGPASSEATVLEAEVEVLGSAAEAVATLGSLAEGADPLAMAPAWVGVEGRSALEGIAVVRDGATGDVVWLPGELLADGSVREAIGGLVGAEAIVHDIEVFVGVCVGSITFTGAIIAWGKLQGTISGSPLTVSPVARWIARYGRQASVANPPPSYSRRPVAAAAARTTPWLEDHVMSRRRFHNSLPIAHPAAGVTNRIAVHSANCQFTGEPATRSPMPIATSSPTTKPTA